VGAYAPVVTASQSMPRTYNGQLLQLLRALPSGSRATERVFPSANLNNRSVKFKVIREVSPLYAGAPEPPRDVRVTSCEADFVELTWVTSDDDSSVIEYIVYYTDSSASDPEQLVEGSRVIAAESSPGSTLSAIIPTKPWVEYTFYVAARNAFRMGPTASHADDGTPAVCHTPETAPRRNPEEVCTRLGPPNQLVITWKVSGTDSHRRSGSQ